MTLVVARRQGSDIYIVADTLISGGHSSRRTPDYGLKILAINSQTMVAYAGSPELAHRLVKEAIDKSACQTHQFLNALYGLREKIGDAELDFIVVEKNGIVCLKDGLMERDVPAAWIGDAGAFNQFQHMLHESGDGPLGTRMNRAMEKVCSSTEIDSVGGPFVAAGLTKNEMRYTGLVHLVSPNYFVQPDLGWQTIDFGTAATVGFGFTTILPPRSGLCGWGIYYFQGGCGFYFDVDLSVMKFELLKGYATTAEEFCRLLEPEIGYLPVFAGQLG